MPLFLPLPEYQPVWGCVLDQSPCLCPDSQSCHGRSGQVEVGNPLELPEGN